MTSAIEHWLRSFALMASWELRSLRQILPFTMIVQILLGAGLVVGYGFLIGDLPQLDALYLTTGLAVVSMITIGMVIAPQLIAQQRAAGVYDYIWSLPVPRTTTVASSLLVNCLIATPGLAITLLVASWRFDLDFTFKPLLIPALFMTLATAASIGFALAHGIKNTLVIGLVTQVLVFFILLFSPISFPAERLPNWLAAIHDWLPFEHCANTVRAGLTDGMSSEVGRSFALLAAWMVASWAVLAWVIGRRD